MNDPIGPGAGAWRPAALERSGAGVPGDALGGPPGAAAVAPERWLGALPADGGPIVGAPASVRAADVDESVTRVLALLGHV